MAEVVHHTRQPAEADRICLFLREHDIAAVAEPLEDRVAVGVLDPEAARDARRLIVRELRPVERAWRRTSDRIAAEEREAARPHGARDRRVSAWRRRLLVGSAGLVLLGFGVPVFAGASPEVATTARLLTVLAIHALALAAWIHRLRHPPGPPPSR